MSAPINKPPSGKLSPFTQACAEASVLLDIAFSQDATHLETARIGRRKKRLDEVRAELNAARARVEAHFAQATMSPDAIRRRIDFSSQQKIEQPFNVMAGKRR
ncbi:hypothetical protein [Cupriavidus taiwanensis]|uniref:hypothetical protein n=1 Tax=Cupriavidus taiwanensis TaxID=164546 RepID=UPI000E12C419|nr:hypothetical protein [Cupriavidus taiwanensis]SPC18457.1 hypothetical protein CT19431_MP30382 [Cupriavidus taiwanensis]